MMMWRLVIFGTFLFLVVLVLAAPNAPTGLGFNDAATGSFDEGSFSLNWTPGGGDAEANYSIYVFSNNILYLTVSNDSETGYAFSNTTEANYTFIVGAVNATGVVVNSSGNVSMYVDSSAPSFVNISNWSDYVNESVAVFLNASDSLSGVDSYFVNDTGNFSINGSQYLVNVSDLAVGVYSLNVSVNDSVGNVVSQIVSVTVGSVPVVAPSSPSTPISSGTVSSEDVVFGGESQKVVMAKRYKFDVSGESHSIVLRLIDRVREVVRLDIFGSLMSLELNVGVPADIDVNSDGVFDITLEVDNIYEGETAVDISVIRYGAVDVVEAVEEIDAETVSDGIDDDVIVDGVDEGSFAWVWWVVVVFVVVVVVWKRGYFRGLISGGENGEAEVAKKK